MQDSGIWRESVSDAFAAIAQVCIGNRLVYVEARRGSHGCSCDALS